MTMKAINQIKDWNYSIVLFPEKSTYIVLMWEDVVMKMRHLQGRLDILGYDANTLSIEIVIEDLSQIKKLLPPTYKNKIWENRINIEGGAVVLYNPELEKKSIEYWSNMLDAMINKSIPDKHERLDLIRRIFELVNNTKLHK